MARKAKGFDVVLKAARSLPDVEQSTAWSASLLKTDHSVNYPSVLVRLPRIHADALRDLLGMAWRFAHERKRKATPAGARRRAKT